MPQPERIQSFSPWMLARLQLSGEKDLMARMDAIIREEIYECRRCYGIYEQTGLVPCKCSICGAERSTEWMERIESQSRLAEDPTQLAPLQRGIRG